MPVHLLEKHQALWVWVQTHTFCSNFAPLSSISRLSSIFAIGINSLSRSSMHLESPSPICYPLLTVSWAWKSHFHKVALNLPISGLSSSEWLALRSHYKSPSFPAPVWLSKSALRRKTPTTSRLRLTYYFAPHPLFPVYIYLYLYFML
jgi:hypothetical protein